MPVKKAPPPGILNFWTPRTEQGKAPAPARPAKTGELQPIIYKGQLFRLVIDAPDKESAEGAIGALLKAVLIDPKAKQSFERQSIFTDPQLGPTTELTLGEIKLYAKAGSLKPDIAARMLIDRIAMALMECRRNPQVEKMLQTIDLRVVTQT